MVTDTYWQLEKEYYTIATDHDLIVRVIEYEEVTRTQLKEDGTSREIKESVPSKVHEFKVKREVVVNSSTYFSKLIHTGGPFKEGGQDRIDLHEDPPASVELWFKLLHGCDVSSMLEGTSITGVWEVLATAHKYGLDPKVTEAKAWFAKWFQAHDDAFDYQEYQSLLFPCYTFDDADRFQQITKHLVYQASRHITERKPDGFHHDHLRMDANIMQQLNAAKGRLKTILHRGLYDPIDNLLKRAKCGCKEKTLYAYELALSNTGVWPLETAFLRKSMNEILSKLGGFPRPNTRVPYMCHDCSIDFGNTVRKAVEDTRGYFDGLCLDCMDASKPKMRDADEDYWHHADPDVHWDIKCRVDHGQPSWYFSFLGRREKMTQWTQKQSGRSNRR